MKTRDTLEAFDRYLAKRGLHLEAVVIGGAALNLLGVISRPTKDCDVLDPPLPPEVTEAARAFAAEFSKQDEALQDDWLNNGPASLAPLLPPGWQERLQPVFTGQAIELFRATAKPPEARPRSGRAQHSRRGRSHDRTGQRVWSAAGPHGRGNGHGL